jgi:hypothetical protein
MPSSVIQHARTNGILGLATRPPQSFGHFCVFIIFHVSVCNVCQLAKSHQLPYNNSIHRSASPLELVFSDVWGPRRLPLLVVLGTTSVLLMTIANSRGSI